MKKSTFSNIAFALAVGIALAFGGAWQVSAQAPVPPTVAPAPASPSVVDQVTVAVQVSNGTPGASVPADISVRLYVFDGQTQVLTKDGKTDAAGKVRFEGVPNKNGRAFGLKAEVGRTTYVTPLTPAKQGEAEVNLPVRVYEVTTDAGQVRIDQLYVLGEALDETHLQITNAYVVSNSGSRTVEGGQLAADGRPGTLRFDLPAGATQVEFQGNDSETFVPIDGGFVFTRGVPPGSGVVQFAVRYNLPYDGQLQLAQGVHYLAQAVSVFWADQGMTLAGATLKEEGTRTRQDGAVFRVFNASTLKAGEALRVDLSGTPKVGAAAAPAEQGPQTGQQAGAQPSQTAPQQAPAIAALPAEAAAQLEGAAILLRSAIRSNAGPGLGVLLLGIAILAGSAAHWLIGRRRARLAYDPVAQRRALVQAVVDLEEEYLAGAIDEGEYVGRCAPLKQALVTLAEPLV